MRISDTLECMDTEVLTKTCRTCETDKPVTEFYKDPATADRLKNHCKPCYKITAASWKSSNRSKVNEIQRVWRTRNPARTKKDQRRARIRSKYKVTHTYVEEMLKVQGGTCAICPNQIFIYEEPVAQIDHDHACCPGANSCGGCLRALLCVSCNQGLGRFKDDVVLMQSAINYIKKYSNEF